MLDTRSPTTAGYCSHAASLPAAPLDAASVLQYPVINGGVGLAGAPSNATALVVNVTAVDATAPTYISVYPDTAARPTVSNLNVSSANAVPNLTTVPIVRDGNGNATIDFYNNSGTVDLIADLAGYYAPDSGSGFTPVSPPCRVFDTRGAGAPCNGSPSVPVGAIGAGQTLTVPFSPVAGVPTDATAVTLNVTAVDATAPTYVTAYPTGGTRPTASNLNLYAPAAVPNLVTVTLGTASSVSFYNNSGTIDLIADIAGYYEAGTGSHFTPLDSPCRIYDSRHGTGNCQPDPDQPGDPGPLGAGPNGVAGLVIPGVASVPVGASAVVLNITGVDATEPTYVSVFPDDSPALPTVSNLNLYTADALPNLAIVPIPPGTPDWDSPAGFIDFYNNAGTVDLIIDLAGYFS